MKAFIYVGGAILPQGIEEHPSSEDLVIAADSGYENARTLGASPTVALGDFDSFNRADLPSDVEQIPFPPKKDFTDSQLAVAYALEKGATELVIIGGLSGRLDHTLSNLALLEELSNKKIRCIINDGFNRGRFLRNDSLILMRSSHFRYFSLLAADQKIRGVELEGCKYPLKNATLKRTHQFAVSNEFDKNCALISVRRGGLYIVESMG